MNAKKIRRRYIDFFAKRGHIEVPSISLLTENDPTTLFTSAGMQPMMPYLLGETHPLGNKIVNSQKCFRSNDIEEVGDNRHTTFFEMLGNWSFGSYFKKEQLEYIFTFLTDKNEGIGLDPSRIYVTVFSGDENQKIEKDGKLEPLASDNETIELWKRLFAKFGIDAKVGERIFPYPAKKNWWSRSGTPEQMPIGEPGGSDSEIFYDFGAHLMLHEKSKWKNEPCHLNCDCGRYWEIGNSVFMQYFKQADGSLKELPKKNIDFGGGLSRLEASTRNDPDIFNISTLSPLIKKIEKISGKFYSDDRYKSSFRIIADHTTAATFLIADGAEPSNKEAGYVLRRLIRRAIRQGKILGIENNFIQEISLSVFDDQDNYADVYPELNNNREKILSTLEIEENKFRKTLNNGLRELEKIINKLKQTKDFPSKISNQELGSTAFYCYESFGFPYEMSLEEFANHGIIYDLDAVTKSFNSSKELKKELSQTLSAGKFKSGLADNSEIITKYHTATHLLHSALRKFLGESVHQSGSNITSDRLRFDFNFDQKLTDNQLKEIENFVNDQIKKSLSVNCETMKFTDAQKQGALAFFGSKYPEIVTVYTIGNENNFISKEVCTGPHIKNTGELGIFEITKEESAGSGKRRIYAILK